MKKILVFAVGAFLVVSAVANAQTVTGGAAGGSSGSGSGSAGPAVIVSPGMPVPIVPPPTQVGSGFIQFNNLTVQSVSGTMPPAEILATNPGIMTVMPPTPLEYNGAGSATAPANAPSAMSTPSTIAVTCYSFNSQSSASGAPITCPTPPTITAPTTPSTAAPTPTSAASPATGASAMPMIPATSGSVAPTPAIAPYPTFMYRPYRIEIDASTKLYLRDRTVATLANFAPGDEINVFGYYNTDGSIQAYLVRDLSQPAQSEFLQLNNVDLVSISTNTTPATLVVAQQTIYPCYGFDPNGNNKQGIACPMGVSAGGVSAGGTSGATPNSAVQNTQVPTALMPIWNVSRKYVITVDSQTILLDSNRTQLQLSSLQVGDELNVYGQTTDNGQTVAADIVRDLSIPATAQTYNGTVTQVNTNGSFVVQTSDGRTITVTSPIQVGAALQLTGVLDRLQNVLSQVTNIMSGMPGTISSPPVMTPASVPGMLRVQGGAPLPPTASGTPNTQN